MHEDLAVATLDVLVVARASARGLVPHEEARVLDHLVLALVLQPLLALAAAEVAVEHLLGRRRKRGR